jgi:hypothetical protein
LTSPPDLEDGSLLSREGKKLAKVSILESTSIG